MTFALETLQVSIYVVTIKNGNVWLRDYLFAFHWEIQSPKPTWG